MLNPNLTHYWPGVDAVAPCGAQMPDDAPLVATPSCRVCADALVQEDLANGRAAAGAQVADAMTLVVRALRNGRAA